VAYADVPRALRSHKEMRYPWAQEILGTRCGMPRAFDWAEVNAARPRWRPGLSSVSLRYL
jgi:hypothetical protein